MPLSDADWTRFLGELKKKKCCLLLGPEISCLTTGNATQTVLQAFSGYMQQRLVEEQIVFDNTIDNFYYRAHKFINSKYPDKLFLFKDEIELFCNRVLNNVPEYFKKLVRLPFNSIISMTPDNFVATTLRDGGYELVEAHYDYSEQAVKNIEITEEMQLVYSVFGSYTNPASVAVTEREQLDQIKRLVSGLPGFPTQVTTRFKDATKSFLFLGFDFNDWHFRLIIDALQIPRPNYSFYPIFSRNHDVGLMTQEFYSEKFGMKFIEPDTDVFLTDLIQRYEQVYGSLDRKLLCVIDYQDDDLKYANAVKDQLKLNGIAKRMDFFDKTEAEGQNIAVLNDKAAAADLYIPLISSTFIKDAGCLERAKKCITQEKTNVVPIITGYSSYETAFPGLKKKSAIILPREAKALSSYPENDLVKVCYEMAGIINCVIR